MKTSSLDFYTEQLISNPQLIQVGYVEEELLEIFDLIQEFQSADGFSFWITDQKLKSIIYKNEIRDGKYIREWAYTFEKKSFFFGKLELDEAKISEDVKRQLLYLDFIFYKIKKLLGIEKRHIHLLLTDSHYTFISHLIYRDILIGKFWGIYNLPTLLEIYQQKQDPLRYCRKTRRE